MEAVARLRKMKCSSAHLTHEAEHTADQGTGAVVAAAPAGANQRDAAAIRHSHNDCFIQI